MPEVVIKSSPVKNLKVFKFGKKLPGTMRKSLTQIGRLLAKQGKRNISGLGFSRDKNRSSKYFGVKGGGIIRSLNYKMQGNDAVLIGSNAMYARFVIPQSLGGDYKGNKITGHYIGDTIKQQKRALNKLFAKNIWKPLQ